MSADDIANLVRSITFKVHQQEISLKNRHLSKLAYWKRKFNFPDVAESTGSAPPNVLNLSSTKLSDREERILALGLQFIPPAKPDIPRIIAGIEGVTRSLNHLETLKVRNAVVQILSRPSQIPPSSNRHRQIIKKLQSDKGSHTVVLDRSDYLSKMTDILQDNTTFSSISPQENLALTKSFRKAFYEMKKSSIITPDQFALFTSCLDREAYIYGLPKIHKPGVPLRPIIAYHLSPAYSVAKFLTRGTPMGSPLSSIMSEIVMGSLDTWINQALPSDIYYWRRYVDDIFCIIKTDSLQLTYSTLHDFNIHIKFTYETEIDSVLPFLDILIIRTPQSFHTSVFHKKHIPPQYTHFSSNSPISFKINTVSTLTKRIFTHCSLPIFKTIERSRIHSLLTTAGYPIDFIEKHTFNPRVHRTTTIHRATCWLPFSPAAVSISRVLRPYGIKVLYNSPPNLATILRHHITKSDKPTLPINSTGAVYSIQCLDCPTSYVGETGRTTGIRISEHRRNIRNKDPKSLIFTHIAQTGHSFDLDHPQVKKCLYEHFDYVCSSMDFQLSDYGCGYHSHYITGAFNDVISDEPGCRNGSTSNFQTNSGSVCGTI
ncbi:hypothetical protein LAZ67_9001275 [Cordylochernes scorpioides]|uniref:Helix-turn-helix domain-containing protein n=1 Tax=Cordylochernes scorpioides TaxID=51811 RepID=A0ABY6KUJ6_9ARAC|nr:hypothetical protein LAZ67_9001275 [Cordylochernes scorpioides]